MRKHLCAVFAAVLALGWYACAGSPTDPTGSQNGASPSASTVSGHASGAPPGNVTGNEQNGHDDGDVNSDGDSQNGSDDKEEGNTTNDRERQRRPVRINLQRGSR